MKISSLHVLCEGYGRVYNTSYSNANVDPRPSVLALGRWVNHKGTKLLCGINLNYLSDDQTLDLQKNLQSILGDRNLRRRVRRLRSTLPQIFDRAYRTYNQDHVRIIAPETLKFYKEPKPQAVKVPVTKAIEPKFKKPDVSRIKPDISKIEADKDINRELNPPEDASQEIIDVENDKKEIDFNKDEPKLSGKELIKKGKETIEKGVEKDKAEKDKNFGKSDPNVDADDLDYEEGEEEQDDGIPSK